MNKKTIIFLHGGPGFKDYLRPYFFDLKSFNCVFYDQIQGSKVFLEDQLGELDQKVSQQSGEVILLGHSWGGVLASNFVIRYPNKIKALVLMCTGLNFDVWTKAFHEELEKLGLQNASMEDIFLAPNEKEIGKIFLDKTNADFSRETFDHLFETYLRKYNIEYEFSKLQIPIINIFSENDVRFPVKIARQIANVNSKVKNFEIPQAGHFPFLLLENRKLIFQILENNLSNP